MTVTRLYLKIEKNDWYQKKANTIAMFIQKNIFNTLATTEVITSGVLSFKFENV